MADKNKKPTEQSREADIASLMTDLKKGSIDYKRRVGEKLSKSPNESARSLADSMKKSLANDTAAMQITREGYGRRLGPDGRPTGPELKKVNGEYTDKYAKGGSVKKYAKGGSVSARADGIAKKGKTNCKMV